MSKTLRKHSPKSSPVRKSLRTRRRSPDGRKPSPVKSPRTRRRSPDRRKPSLVKSPSKGRNYSLVKSPSKGRKYSPVKSPSKRRKSSPVKSPRTRRRSPDGGNNLSVVSRKPVDEKPVDEKHVVNFSKDENPVRKPVDEKHVVNFSKDDVGIVLGNKLISSISGPVYISILKPSTYLYNTMRAPIFVLFGDKHGSKENLCTECVCIDKPCCYPVYSDEFLKIIDNLARDPKYPVDFSIESGIKNSKTKYGLYGMDHLSEYDENIVKAVYRNRMLRNLNNYDNSPLKLLRERIESCYNVPLKIKDIEEFNLLCPSPNIRWQLADSRQSYYKGGYKYDFENFLFDMDALFNLFLDEDKFPKIEEILDSIIGKFENKSEYFDILKHILDKDFIKYVPKDNSPIFKQIRNMNQDMQKTWNNWIKLYYEYIYEITVPKFKIDVPTLKEILIKIIDYIKLFSITDNKDERNKIIEELQKYIKEESKRDVGEKFGFYKFYNINHIIQDTNLIGLDLYFLTRSFKKPQGTEQPLVSFGYFGATHSKNITHFLLKIMGDYEQVYLQDESDKTITNRCIKIDKHVDLQGIIDSYKNKIRLEF